MVVHCCGCHATRASPMSRLILSKASCIFMQLPWDRSSSMLCSAACHLFHGSWCWLRNHSGSSGFKCRGMRLFVLRTHSGFVSGSSMPGGSMAGAWKKPPPCQMAARARCKSEAMHLLAMNNIDEGTRHIVMILCGRPAPSLVTRRLEMVCLPTNNAGV